MLHCSPSNRDQGAAEWPNRAEQRSLGRIDFPIRREDVAEWFAMDADSPCMLLVADVLTSKRKPMTVEEQALFGIDKPNILRSEIPAVTHVDHSVRVQTVHHVTNPRYEN